MSVPLPQGFQSLYSVDGVCYGSPQGVIGPYPFNSYDDIQQQPDHFSDLD